METFLILVDLALLISCLVLSLLDILSVRLNAKHLTNDFLSQAALAYLALTFANLLLIIAIAHLAGPLFIVGLICLIISGFYSQKIPH